MQISQTMSEELPCASPATNRRREGLMLMRLVALGSLLIAYPALAQMPPTATEAFNLRIVCQLMADKKAEEKANFVALDKDTKTIFAYHASRYDPKANRCYVELQGRYEKRGHDSAIREVYDGQIDNLLAATINDDNEKRGMVFDQDHKMTDDKKQSYDDADAYMNVMMADH